MTQLFANNAYGSLGATLASGATSLTLATGQGARFPSPTGGDFFLLTLVGLDSNGNENAWEIVKVTGRSTDALTIVRAQEGTTAATWIAGTRAELRATAGTLDSFTDATEAAAAAPVQSVAGRTGAVVLTKTDVGLANVENKSSATIRGELTSSNVTTALGFTPENAANRNAVNGYAGLDSSGLVPSSLLPSFVDDVLEYANYAALPAIGEAGKIYVLLTPYTSGGITSSQFRWSGSAYIAIVASPGTTDAVTEGSLNLYFTNARAQAALAGMYLPIGGGTLTGDLVFASGTKITGDFSSATRTVVQTSTTNGSTNLSLIPNGTAVNSQINVWGNSNTTNAPLGTFVVNSTSVRLTSGAAGTGTILPLSFWIGSNEAARFDPTTRNFLLGNTVDDGSNKLQVTGSGTVSGNFGVGTNAPTSFGGGFRNLEIAGSTTTDGGVLRSRTSDSSIIGDFFTSNTYGGAVLRTTTNHPLVFRPYDLTALVLNSVASAVNYLRLDNAATGNSPTLSAQGSDTNVNLTLTAKGTGKVVSTPDMLVNGVTVGRGAGNVGTNTALGASALASASQTGTYNAAGGYRAFEANTSGSYNAAFGSQAAISNTTGSGLAAFGYNSLVFNTTGNSNTAIGQEALRSNTIASYNTAVGYRALYSHVTGGYTTALGYQAGYSHNTTTGSVYIGYSAGYLSTGGDNTIIGNQAGYNLTTGQKNTIVGPYGAGNAMTTGSSNTIIGGYTGNNNGLDIRTANGYVVLSDGDARPLLSMKGSASVALEGASPVTGTGISFPVTQNASSDANTLDDYEEGTWTPVLQFGSASTGITYGSRKAQYVKIGRYVFVNIYLYLSNKGSSTGQAAIAGFPFPNGTHSDGSPFDCFIPLGVRGNMNTGGNQVALYSGTIGNTSFTMYQCNLTGGTNSGLLDSSFNNSTELNFNFWYQTSA